MGNWVKPHGSEGSADGRSTWKGTTMGINAWVEIENPEVVVVLDDDDDDAELA